MHRLDAEDRDAHGTRPPGSEQTARFLQAIGINAGTQQGEVDQVVLRAAAADALVIPGERRKRRDRARKIAVFEGREAARQRRKIRAGRVTAFTRKFLDLPGAGGEPGVIAYDRLREHHMQIGEPAAWLR